MTELNYINTAYEIIDLLRSKGMDVIKIKETLSECNKITDETTIRYVEEKFYNIEDISHILNINI